MLGLFKKKPIRIASPIQGRCIDLTDVEDQVFSQKMVGEGFAVVPSIGEVVAPFDGEVILVFHTHHALGLKSKDGIELLIHVGLDTVELNGEGFEAVVKVGDQVKKGDLLLKFDLKELIAKNIIVTSPVVITQPKKVIKVSLYKDANEQGLEVYL